ncbi:MAG TPA: cytochrome c-type biogenesis protein [Rhizomicrobium sp.]|nr:cytochrome c-type biogenesis protein [Rhizomicrobium sp.]
MTRVIALLLMVMAGAFQIAWDIAPALAAPVGETFSDPVLETRARNLQRQLRCLVCQGESIDDSASPFAVDVRRLVRQQIADGKSDQQIFDFLVARYGDFILMKPPVQPNTWLLWLMPFLVLGGAGAVAWVTVKKASVTEG